MTTNTNIEARGLIKDFGHFRAVNNISFSANKGEICGLIGPNGAGKTTTMRMLSGLLTPSAGEAFIGGKSMTTQTIEARKKLGFLTGDMDLYRRLKPYEILRYFGGLYEVPKAELENRIQELSKAFGIYEYKDRYCEKLSTGQKQKISIVRTLIHDPEVVILDEPTTGLDIMAQEFILQFIHKIAKEYNKTIIFSTHNMTEVEELCDNIVIIDKGNICYQGDISTLKEQQQTNSLHNAFFGLVNKQVLDL